MLSSRNSRLANRNCNARRAISLIEVLISMFVLLFGLMGVAAIFPVGSHYVIEGEKFDLGAGIAQNAFEELKGRGMLRPEVWHYADPQFDLSTITATDHHPLTGEYDWLVIQSRTINNGTVNPDAGAFNIIPASPVGPGHAFVIDPMGATSDSALNNLDLFPFTNLGGGNNANPWHPNNGFVVRPGSSFPLSGERWPVRRITVLDTNGLMSKPVAETIFRLRDDLAVEQPDRDDVPSIQRWDLADVDPATGNNNGTPNDLSDDTLLRRQYKGDYSWFATVVPGTTAAVEALQPANVDYGQINYDVSVVVFRKRDDTPSVASERLINAELLQGGELVIYSPLEAGQPEARQQVDDAVDDLRTGNWISLMGVNQVTGDFVMKWYRLLALDDETTPIVTQFDREEHQGRRAMLIGPDWPVETSALVGGAVIDLRVGIFPGAISVVTKPLRMESSSLWNLE